MYALTQRSGLLLLVGLLAACACEAPAPPSTPQTVFEAMKAHYLASDWEALYELNAPSERAEVEATWRTALASDAAKAIVKNFANEAGTSEEEIRAMTFLEVVLAIDTAKAKRPSRAKTRDLIRRATFVGVGKRQGDSVMVTMRVNDREQDLPMKRENGRWYLWRRLTAIADFDN